MVLMSLSICGISVCSACRAQ
jgi:hypothetical protein